MQKFFGAILILPLLIGCLCDPEHFAMPDVLHPGHITKQRERMERFDPFARSDIGPPIEGDRPNGCAQPMSAPKHLDKYKPQGL